MLRQEGLIRPIGRVRADRVYPGTAGLDVGRTLKWPETIETDPYTQYVLYRTRTTLKRTRPRYLNMKDYSKI